MNWCIYSIDQDNISLIFPRLQVEEHIKSDIQNAISNGKIVIIPERNINFHEWSGTGYVILDPEDGSGAYMLSNGTAGFWWWVGVVGYVIAEMAFWLCVAVEVVLAVLFLMPVIAALGPALAKIGVIINTALIWARVTAGAAATAIGKALVYIQNIPTKVYISTHLAVENFLGTHPDVASLVSYNKMAIKLTPPSKIDITPLVVGTTNWMIAQYMNIYLYASTQYQSMISYIAKHTGGLIPPP